MFTGIRKTARATRELRRGFHADIYLNRETGELFAVEQSITVRICEERTRPAHQFLAYIYQTVAIKVCAGTELQKKTIHRLKRKRGKRNTIDKIGFGIRDIVVADKFPEVRAKILGGKEV